MAGTVISGVSSTGRRDSEHRLPALRGWGLRLYTGLWLLLFPVAFTLSIWGIWIAIDSTRDPGLHVLGFDAQYPDWTVNAVWGREASASGLRPGDHVVALDGRPIDAATQQWHVLVPLPDGHVSSLTVGANGSERTVRLPSRMVNETGLYANAGIPKPLALGIGFIDQIPILIFITAAILLFRRRRDPVPAMLSLGFLIILVPNYAGGTVLMSYGIGDLLYCAAPGWALFNIGVIVFPSGRIDRPWMFPIILLTAIWGVVSCFIPLMPSSLAIVAKALYPMLAIAAVLILTLRYRHLPAGAERQQVRWALLGFAIGAVCLAVSYPVEAELGPLTAADARWLVWGNTVMISISMLGVAAMTTGLLVSLLRYRLYDVDAAISRSVAYGTLTILLVAIFAGSEKIVEVMGEEYFGKSLGMLAGGLGAAIAAVMIAPLHHRLSHWTEHRFRKSLIHLRQHLPLLLNDLREMAGLDRVAAATLDGVSRGVSATRAALIVGDALQAARGIAAEDVATWRLDWKPATHDGLDCDRSDAVFPVRVPLDADGHGRIGWLLVGPRPDGTFYGKDERETLAEIADPVARAVEIVRKREAYESARGLQVTELQRALATVLDRLTSIEQAIGFQATEPLAG